MCSRSTSRTAWRAWPSAIPGRKGLGYEELCGKGVNQIPFAQVERASRYACEDADMTLEVHQALWPRLQADERLRKVYELEIATSEALYRIERNGVLIDAATLARQSHEPGQRIVQPESEAYEIAGQPFNLASPKQLGEIFFDKLGLPVIKKTATGARSTDEEVLEKLAEDHSAARAHPGAPLAVQAQGHLYRQAPGPGASAHRPRAHALRAGGRRHRAPEQQRAQPAEHPDPHARGPARARGLRRAAGCPIASADYSQIELRIMAHLSQDPALLKAFAEGRDVHRATAAEIFGLIRSRSAPSSAAMPR